MQGHYSVMVFGVRCISVNSGSFCVLMNLGKMLNLFKFQFSYLKTEAKKNPSWIVFGLLKDVKLL